jgi:hypothetical protein
MRRFRLILCIVVFSCTTKSQDFSGSFTGHSDGQQATLTLKKNAAGDFSGTLQSGGMTLAIKGRVKNNILSGTVGDESEGFRFRAHWQGSQLAFTMSEADESGDENEIVMFERSSSTRTTAQKPRERTREEVIINDAPLSKRQIAEIEKQYGVKPKPGNYWYDAKSGLYGVVGYPAYGYMQPNHRFGSMKKDASNGNTGIFINGRELPPLEYTVWSYMVGSWIQAGTYWLDHQGNAGYEGNPTPVINLFVAAKQNGYQGQGGSGDNFWTTRFSAGNYDSGGSRGYVSVPGYGPIGYGF